MQWNITASVRLELESYISSSTYLFAYKFNSDVFSIKVYVNGVWL